MIGKRVLLILLPALIAFAVVYGTYRALKPRLQTWILGQITSNVEKRLPLKLKIEELDWSLFFPEVQLAGIEASSEEWKLPLVKVQRVRASLDLFSLISGRFVISSLYLEKPNLEVDLDPLRKPSDKKNSNQPLPLKEFFQTLRKIPITRLGVSNGQILISSEKLKTGLFLGSTDILILKGKDRLNLQWDFNDSVIDHFQSGEIPFRVQGEAAFNANTLDISSLKVSALSTLFTAKGTMSDLRNILIQPKGSLEFELLSDLDRVANVGKNLIQLPELKGRISASGRLDLDAKGKVGAGFKFSSQGLQIDQFKIGDSQFVATLANDLIRIPHLAMTNEAGLLDLKNIEFDFSKNDSANTVVKADVLTRQIDLQELLVSLGVGDLPLELFIGADLKCEGPVYPQTSVRCQGAVKGDQLEVRTGETAKDILVQIDAFQADGEFTVGAHDVQYKANLKVGANQGSTDGLIDYKEGFKINYASPAFDFKNLRTLAGLKFEGSTEIKGSTQGDSSAATFQMKLKTKDFVFEDFILGSPSTQLSYKNGILNFEKIESQFTTTRYQADVQVDLNKGHIRAEGELPQFEANEVLGIFERIFQLPVELLGSGKAKVRVDGPLNSIGKLSYNLDASIQQGSVAGENFDSVQLKLNSAKGEMKIEKARLQKGRNVITATGESFPNGQIDILIRGQGLPLEESENISRLGTQMAGLLDFETRLQGHIVDPEVLINGRIYQFNVEEQEFAESKFNLEFKKQMMSGTTDLFGGQLLSQFKIPLSDAAPFQLDLKAQNWNYTTLLALVGGGALLNEYKASLTGDLNLNSERGGLWAASGRGTIQKFLLQRGSLVLQNKLPMELTMIKGLANLSNFRVDGEETYFEFRGKNISKEDLNLRIAGQANLRLFQIFAPFLEELSGSANLGVDFSGPLLKPEVLGNSNIRNGFIKLKGFPHAFEKTSADVQFSQSKILISQFNGQIAGGTFNGDGGILINGPQNLPTNIKARLENVSLNVPDQVRTNGDADITFSGNWFPFTLSGTYHVQGGFMDKELDEQSSVTSLKQSSYLPKMILQSAFEPVLLDLNIVLDRPLGIKNSLVEGSVSGNILVKGAPTSPSLGGQIVAEKGTKALFRDKVFEVQNANVRFTNEVDINPELYVSARSRISEYDINMLIQGNAKNPVIKLSSLPPLSDQDIISLIALGVKSQTLEKQVQAGNKAKEDVAQGAAFGVFTQSGPLKKLQETTGVELQFSTSYDDTRNVSVQRYTLSKKLSDRVTIAGTRTSGSTAISNEASLQYNLTDSLSAVGRYEDRQYNENANLVDSTRDTQSILGIDLEFKKEFK